MSAKLYLFTPEMIEELKLLYPVTKNENLAKHFNCSYSKITNLSSLYGLKKDVEWRREISREKMRDPNHPGRKYLIQKGNISHNKGKRQSEFMSAVAIERTKATRFKPGQKGWNHKEIGYERINVDGYIEIKVAEPNVFKLKQRVVWVENFGEIPKSHNVQFKDGDRLNCSPENLYCISRSDQLKFENSYIAKYPKELQLAIQAKGALKRQINKLLKDTEK